MYRIVAYHGKSRNGEVERDLKLLWDGLRKFALYRHIQHIYCFQAVQGLALNKTLFKAKPWTGEVEKNKPISTDLLLVLQYGDNIATKLALHGKPKLASQIRNHVDYWLYVRDGSRQC